ncbi:beta-propeller domain-containing protein [Peribacillus saganii]|uniref:beta-propeller domain-containing protein n=1 Tax=Peribacillus saganii TaxID=2303992 RepID=UPI001314C65F|nr:beta-propeller domain-containing protein [Peribacillus saganii]
MAITLFDVTDVTQPKEKFSEVIGANGTSSPLNYDHRALLFNKKTGLFAFPVSIYSDVKNSEEKKLAFQGALVFTVDKTNGFTLQDRITHIEEGKLPLYEEWGTGIERLIYIGDTMFALSPSKITSHSLTDYKRTGELLLQ